MRDWSLPGYKYLGPGNKLNKGKPRNYNDWVAYKHDVGYDELIQQNVNPYWNWNEADEQALKQFSLRDYGGALGKGFFAAKKAAHQLGLIDRVGEKRKRIDPVDVNEKRITGDGGIARSLFRLRGNNPARIEPERPSFFNLRAADNNNQGAMSDSNAIVGSGNDPGLKETPIDDPFVVYRGPPDFTFVSMPYIWQAGLEMNDVFNVDHVFRLTSPYDPQATVTSSDINPGAGTTTAHTASVTEPDGTLQNARWYAYYADMYKYYHVVGCRWNVYVENKGGEPIVVHQMFANDEIPSPEATNEDMVLWQGVRTHYLKSPYNAVNAAGKIDTNEAEYNANVNDNMNENDLTSATNINYQNGNHVVSRGGSVSCSFSGEYKPGDYRRQIILDSQVENWTSVAANPALTERLIIRLKPENPAHHSDGFPYGDDIKYFVRVTLEYLTEFKELDSSLRWPIQRQPARVTLSASGITSTL